MNSEHRQKYSGGPKKPQYKTGWQEKSLLVAVSVMMVLLGIYVNTIKSKPVAIPPTLGKYVKADFSKLNSFASENGLGGTKVFVVGQLTDINEVDNGTDVSFMGIFEDTDHHQWIIHLNTETFTPKETYSKALGKKSIALGTYDGFSDLMKKPTITLDKLYLIESKEIINGIGLILEMGSKIENEETVKVNETLSAVASTNEATTIVTTTAKTLEESQTETSTKEADDPPAEEEIVSEVVEDEYTEPAINEVVSSDIEQANEYTEQTIEDESIPRPALAFQRLPGTYRRNEIAYFSIVGIPGETYYITVISPKGNELNAKGLGPVVADANGVAAWNWKVGGRTSFGTGTMTISGGGETINAPYTIIE